MPEAAPSLDLLVSGHTNIDHFIWVRELPKLDRTVPILREETRLGGTAANIARAAGERGVRVALLSFVGEDFPEPMARTLGRSGVDTKGLTRVAGASTTLCHIFEDGRGHQMTVIRPGPMDAVRPGRLPTTLFSRCRWLHLTTGDPAYQLAVKAAARRHGVRVAADPAQELFYRWDARGLRRLLEGAEILFGNRAEIARIRALLRIRTLDALLDLVPLVVMTRGRLGAVAYSRAGIVRSRTASFPTPKGVTGAGDAFRGGFYTGWFRGEPLSHCLDAGNRAAAEWLAATSA